MTIKKSNFKILYLLRHAKSGWSDHSLSDFERPLNKRGLLQAPKIAAILAAKEIYPQVIISSPANRAFSTAKIIAASLRRDQDTIGSDKRIYEASVDALMYLIQEIDDEIDSAMLVGHNPGFSHLLNTLSRQKVAPLPTCALIQLRLDIDHWNELEPECADLISADVPPKEE